MDYRYKKMRNKEINTLQKLLKKDGLRKMPLKYLVLMKKI